MSLTGSSGTDTGHGRRHGGGVFVGKVLIIDDYVPLLLLYADELEKDGYRVIANADPGRTMSLIEAERPDVVVLGIKMGRVNGLDILQEIRNKHYNLPVILHTVYPGYRYDPRAMAADYYVVKDSDTEKVKSRIRMALECVAPINGLSYPRCVVPGNC